MQHEAYGGGELSAGDHDRKLALDTASLDGRCRIKRTPKSFASLHFQLVEGNLDHDWPFGKDSDSVGDRPAEGQVGDHADVFRGEDVRQVIEARFVDQCEGKDSVTLRQ